MIMERRRSDGDTFVAKRRIGVCDENVRLMLAGGDGPNAFARHHCRGGDRRESRGSGSFASLGAEGEIAASDPVEGKRQPMLSVSPVELAGRSSAWSAGTGPGMLREQGNELRGCRAAFLYDLHPARAGMMSEVVWLPVIRIFELAEVDIIRQDTDGHDRVNEHFIPRVQMTGNGLSFPCQSHVRVDFAVNDIAVHADNI